MLEEVDRLSGLVDRLLTLSRAESGQAKLSVEVVDLRELAEDVVSHLGVLAEEKRQTMTVDVAGAPRGLGDRLVLRQSLINLVDNAIKYTPAGGTIHIRVSDTPSGPAIEVSDTGPGIAPEVRTRIFDRYDRGGNSRSDDIGGSGLGLAIAKWAVEVNGGLLSLESTTGTGSTFRMTLPRLARIRRRSGVRSETAKFFHSRDKSSRKRGDVFRVAGVMNRARGKIGGGLLLLAMASTPAFAQADFTGTWGARSPGGLPGAHSGPRPRRLSRSAHQRVGEAVRRQLGSVADHAAGRAVPRARLAVHLSRPAEPPHLGRARP